MSLTLSGLNDLNIDSLIASSITINDITINPQSIFYIKSLRSSVQEQIDAIPASADYTECFRVSDISLSYAISKIIDVSNSLSLSISKIIDVSNSLSLSISKIIDISNSLSLDMIKLVDVSNRISIIDASITSIDSLLAGTTVTANGVKTQADDNTKRITETEKVAIGAATAAGVLAAGSAGGALYLVTGVPAIAGLVTSVGAINGSLIIINEKIKIDKDDIKRNKDDITDLNRDVGNLQSSVSDNTSNISAIESDVSTLKTNVYDITEDVMSLNTKTQYLLSDLTTTYINGSDFLVNDKYNNKLFRIDQTLSFITMSCPFQVKYNSYRYLYAGSDIVRIENTGSFECNVPTLINGAFTHSNGLCKLAQNIGYTGVTITNLNNNLVKQEFTSKANGYIDATISVSPNPLSSFGSYLGSNNYGTIDLTAYTINLNASVINLGTPLTQVNLAGKDFTEYFTQYRRVRNPVAP